MTGEPEEIDVEDQGEMDERFGAIDMVEVLGKGCTGVPHATIPGQSGRTVRHVSPPPARS